MRSFVKIKTLGNGEITLSFTGIGKSCLSRKLLTSQICLLTIFPKIKFSQKFLNLQHVAQYMFNFKSDYQVLMCKITHELSGLIGARFALI